MNTVEVDVAIIGAGSAGLNARRAVMAAGKSLVLFDAGPLGTTCARVGCMPSKLLIAAAERAHSAKAAAEFGIETNVAVDSAAVMRRVRAMRDLFVSKTVKGIMATGAPIAAHAEFVGPNRLRAGGKEYQANAIVLASGSAPVTPSAWKEFDDVLLSSDDVFELERLPASLLVIGAGVIGLELGQAMHRLGVRVHILDVSGQLGGESDPDMIAAIRASLGVPMDLEHSLEAVERTDEGLRVRFKGEDGQRNDNVWQHVLITAGRTPRTAGLNLAAAGLDPLPAIDPETGRVGRSAVYVAGDVSGAMIMHEAAHEGVIAGSNAALHPNAAPSTRKTPLGIVFTDPQIARVGHRSDLMTSFDFGAQARAKVMGRATGRLELYAKADGTLTGASIVGPDAEHLAHLVAWSVQAGFDAERALSMPFYHPTLEEALQGALRKLLKLSNS